MRIEEALAQTKEATIIHGALTLENMLTTLTAAGLLVGMFIVMLTVFIK
jgi:hypothetical protein